MSHFLTHRRFLASLLAAFGLALMVSCAEKPTTPPAAAQAEPVKPAAEQPPAAKAEPAPAGSAQSSASEPAAAPPPVVQQTPPVSTAPPAEVTQTPPMAVVPAPVPPAPPVVLPSSNLVYFEYDQYTVKPEFNAVAADFANYLIKKPDATLKINGHCDERGSREYNLALGQRRADAVRRAIVLLGVDEARLETVSFGKERPAVSGHDEAAWSKNRRAVLELK